MPPPLGALTLLLSLATTCLAAADDMATVRARLLQSFCYPAAADAKVVAGDGRYYANTLRPDGTWADINYNTSQDRTYWGANKHLTRVNIMAQAVSFPPSPELGNATIMALARKALAWWTAADPQNVNWWFNIISTPSSYATALLMLGVAPAAGRGDFPTPAEAAAGLAIMLRAAWWNASLGYEVTGANRAWMIETQLLRGTLPYAPNASALAQGFAALWADAVVVNRSTDYNAAQGIQHDQSYQFHSSQLQIGSYGQDFAAVELLMAEVSAGTAWAAPAATVDVLCAHWALGAAWLSVGAAYTWTAVGRQDARPGLAAEYGISLNTTRIRALALRCSVPAHGAALQAWAAAIDGTGPAAPPQSAAAHFYASDITVVRRPGWVAFIHQRSARTRAPECGNGENLLARYQGEGTLTVYGTACGNGTAGAPLGCGQELAGIFPLLNWTMLPGVTAQTDLPLPDCDGQCCWLREIDYSATFAGAATDGVYAAAAMDTRVNTLTARRSWLALDGCVVSLTAGARDVSGRRLATALVQRWLADPTVAAGFANGTVLALPDGDYPALPDATWLHADGTGWLMLTAAASGATAVPLLTTGARAGNWASIGASNQNVSGRTLLLAAAHGSGLGGAAAWASITLPNVTAVAMPALAATQAGAVIVANTPAVQAAADAGAGVLAAVFWPPVACNTSDGGSGRCAGGAGGLVAPLGPSGALAVNVSVPCMLTLTLRPAAGGASGAGTMAASQTLTVAVANPDTPGGLAVTVTLGGLGGLALQPSPECPGATANGTALTFSLPADAVLDMGRSVVQVCRLA